MTRRTLRARAGGARVLETPGLLRHHDRAWRLFWPRLRLLALPEVHRYAGVAAAHLADLLTRIERVATEQVAACR